jgi:hypothetical protein
VPAQVSSLPQTIDQKGLGGGVYGSSLQAETTRSPVITANYNAPITAPVSGDMGRSTSFPQNKDLSIGTSRGLYPVPPEMGNLLPLDRTATAGRPEVPVSAPGPARSSSTNNQLKYVLDRLRQLGATYFVLEPCGDEKGEFRFYCRMSIGGNPRVTKPFWCFDGDPLKAMTQVLRQVEEWQTGGG